MQARQKDAVNGARGEGIGCQTETESRGKKGEASGSDIINDFSVVISVFTDPESRVFGSYSLPRYSSSLHNEIRDARASLSFINALVNVYACVYLSIRRLNIQPSQWSGIAKGNLNSIMYNNTNSRGFFRSLLSPFTLPSFPASSLFSYESSLLATCSGLQHRLGTRDNCSNNATNFGLFATIDVQNS